MFIEAHPFGGWFSDGWLSDERKPRVGADAREGVVEGGAR